MTQLDLTGHLTIIQNYAKEMFGSNTNKKTIFSGDLKYDGPAKLKTAKNENLKFDTPMFVEPDYSGEYRRLCEEFKTCQKCKFSEFNSLDKILIGIGGAKPKVMFIGKAPKWRNADNNSVDSKCAPFW